MHQQIGSTEPVRKDSVRRRHESRRSSVELSLDDAIKGAETRKCEFYVEQPPGDAVDVEVAETPSGTKYLKTTADGDEPNNLLALPECP